MKRKSLTMILCLLTCLSLVGVGFAAWVITAPADGQTNGNIEVDTVTDNRLNITVVNYDSNVSIKFGYKAYETNDTVKNNGWLTNTNGIEENLSVSFKVTVKRVDEAALDFDDVTLSVVSAYADNSKLTEAVTNNYIVVPTGAGSDNGVTVEQLSSDSNAIVYKVTYTCAWGSEFIPAGESAAVNPYQFYNTQEYSDALADDAITALEALQAINYTENSGSLTLNDTLAKFNLTITATVN